MATTALFLCNNWLCCQTLAVILATGKFVLLLLLTIDFKMVESSSSSESKLSYIYPLNQLDLITTICRLRAIGKTWRIPRKVFLCDFCSNFLLCL